MCRTNVERLTRPSLLIVTSMLLAAAGCGDEPGPFYIGQGQFELSGDLDEDFDCELVWGPPETGQGGSVDHRRWEAAVGSCGGPTPPGISMRIFLWERDDGTFPEVVEQTYPLFSSEFDCPADEDLCAVLSYHRTDSAAWYAVPGEGTLTISTMTETRVAGRVDANMSGETPSLRLTGEFEATLD